ncbi:type VI secretion system baseplate subunit TssG [Dyella sp. S184]|uniref:type VI secretion system baseplate subunit TssG n=1 Tax=Dyella sp. S184 TaxID=1641862 RepID=UPI00131AEE5F|nr:type VI secretion system baseplate subunit TssG [Dyella sp. S184]
MDELSNPMQAEASTPLPLLAGALTVPGLLPHAPLDALLAEPERYGFFQAVRLLYRAHGMPMRAGVSSAHDTLRFTVPPSLNFPPCELQSLDRATQDDSESPRYTMSVNFLGLTGPSGVLPRHYTEWLMAQQKARDPASRDFLDIFNHRLLSLFWRAWAKHRTELSQELAGEKGGGGSGVLRHIYDLIGLGTPALHALVEPRAKGGSTKTKLPAAALGYYSGLVAQHPHGVGALAQVIGDVVDAPVEVIGCHGTWQRIPPRDRTRLGKTNQRFGDGCVLGSRFWDRQTTVRVRIGPMRLRGFDALLPQRELLGAVVELLRFLTGLALDLEIQLVLQAEAVPRARLGGARAARLGWNSWLAGRRSERPADECHFVFTGLT